MTQLGAYTLGERLGSGAMGTVYLARDDGGAPVAVKVLRAPAGQESEARARFAREARLGRDIAHPNVVRVLAAGEDALDGATVPYLVMEYIEGETLRSLLDREGALPEAIYRHIATEVAHGLAALHASRIVHRDVKPQNIMITPEDRVVLMDLGIARQHNAAHTVTRAGQFVGSIAYAPPESFESDEAGTASFDVWSLGVLLHELATGQHPFERATAEATLHAILQERPPAFRDAGADAAPFMEALVDRLLTRSRTDRPADAKAVLALLEQGENSVWWRRHAARTEGATPWTRRLDLRMPFVGRDAEQGVLASRLDAGPGSASVHLVLGDRACGKTRLVHEVLSRRARHSVHHVACGTPQVRAWMHDLLHAHFASETMATDLGAAVGSDTLVGRVLSAIDPRVDEAAQGPGTGLVTGVLLEALRQIAARPEPFVLWLDDVDKAPLDLRLQMRDLARAAAETHVTVIMTAVRQPLGEELREIGEWAHVRLIELEPLGRDEVWELLAAYLGADHLAEELIDMTFERSAGSPAVVLGLIDRLVDEGYLQRHPDGVWSLTRSRTDLAAFRAPSSASGIWRNRVRALEADDRELLDAAACVGLEFEPELLADVLGRPALDVLRRLTRLERGPRLVRGAGRRFEFPVPAAREIVLDLAPDALLTAYHAAIATQLPRFASDQPAGFIHWRVCEQWRAAGRLEQAADHIRPAALHMLGIGAVVEANQLIDAVLASDMDLPLDVAGRLVFERAATDVEAGVPLDMATLERWQQRAREAGHAGCQAYCLLTRGHREAMAGRFNEAHEFLGRALRHAQANADPDVLMRVVHTHSQVALYLGQHEESIALLEEALQLSPSDPELLVRSPLLLITLSAHWSSLGRFDKSLPQIEEALRTAREHGHTRAELESLRILGAIYDRLGRWSEAVEATEQAIEIARLMRNRTNGASSHGNQSDFLAALGQPLEAWKHARAAMDLARETGPLRVRAFATHAFVQRGALLGRHEEVQAAQEALRVELDASPDVILRAQWQLGWSVLHANREAWSASEDACQEGLEILGPEGSATWRCRLLFTAGRAAALAGNHPKACALLREAFAVGRPMTTEIGWPRLAGAWLATLDDEAAADVAAHAAEQAGPLEVAVQLELLWLAARHGSGDEAADAAAEARQLLMKMLAPLSDVGRRRARDEHWLHRRITELAEV